MESHSNQREYVCNNYQKTNSSSIYLLTLDTEFNITSDALQESGDNGFNFDEKS